MIWSLGDHVRQAVAAQQQTVALEQADVSSSTRTSGFGPERAGQDVAVRMDVGLLRLISPALTMPVDQRVVLASAAGAPPRAAR